MQYRKSRNRKRNRNRKSHKGGVTPRKILLQFPIMIHTPTGLVRVVGVGNPPQGNVEERVPPSVMDGAEEFLRGVIEGMPGVQILGRMRLNIPLDVYELELNVTRTQAEIRDLIDGSPHRVFVYQGVRYSLGRPTITWVQN
jgi:hypothetical protein